jgi:uncharacterized protein (TIGR02246 family)
VNEVEALRQLLERYARAADERDVDALAALFTDDATVIGTRGEQTIGEWLDSMRAPRTFPVSMHLFGNPLVQVADGGARATLDTYAVVHQIGGEGQGDLTLGVRYLDEAVRDRGDQAGEWRIRRRRATTVWMR